jgi:hypothetical protein
VRHNSIYNGKNGDGDSKTGIRPAFVNFGILLKQAGVPQTTFPRLGAKLIFEAIRKRSSRGVRFMLERTLGPVNPRCKSFDIDIELASLLGV